MTSTLTLQHAEEAEEEEEERPSSSVLPSSILSFVFARDLKSDYAVSLAQQQFVLFQQFYTL